MTEIHRKYTAAAVAAQDNAEENQPTVFEETVENTIPENKTAKSTSSFATAKSKKQVRVQIR